MEKSQGPMATFSSLFEQNKILLPAKRMTTQDFQWISDFKGGNLLQTLQNSCALRKCN